MSGRVAGVVGLAFQIAKGGAVGAHDAPLAIGSQGAEWALRA